MLDFLFDSIATVMGVYVPVAVECSIADVLVGPSLFMIV